MQKWITVDDVTKSLAEFVGTFIFVLFGVGALGAAYAAGGQDNQSLYLMVGLAHGLGIMIAVAATGRISGGHLNPAVTIAAVVTRNLSLARGVLYIGAQLGAAVLAVAVINSVAFDRDNLGLHQITSSITERDALFLEIFLTFTLVFTVFATAFDRRGSTMLAPLAIGMAITAGHFVALGLTGASMNPARSFGPAAFFGNFTSHWVYWAGPVTGGLLAGLIYVYFFAEKEARGRVWKIKLFGDAT